MGLAFQRNQSEKLSPTVKKVWSEKYSVRPFGQRTTENRESENKRRVLHFVFHITISILVILAASIFKTDGALLAIVAVVFYGLGMLLLLRTALAPSSPWH